MVTIPAKEFERLKQSDQRMKKYDDLRRARQRKYRRNKRKNKGTK